VKLDGPSARVESRDFMIDSGFPSGVLGLGDVTLGQTRLVSGAPGAWDIANVTDPQTGKPTQIGILRIPIFKNCRLFVDSSKSLIGIRCTGRHTTRTRSTGGTQALALLPPRMTQSRQPSSTSCPNPPCLSSDWFSCSGDTPPSQPKAGTAGIRAIRGGLERAGLGGVGGNAKRPGLRLPLPAPDHRIEPQADSAIYVAPYGNDTLICGEASTPCSSLAAAVARATVRQVDSVIMRGGLYSGPHNRNIDLARRMSLEAAPGESPTVDCGLQGRCLAISADVRVVGLHFMRGSTTLTAGGCVAVFGGTVLFVNVSLSGCIAESGGAVAALGSTLRMEGCNLANNTALVEGGAIFSNTSQVSLSHCVLHNNTAGGLESNVTALGGGMSLHQSVLSIMLSNLSHNTVLGSAISLIVAGAANGGAISLVDTEARLVGCVMEGNTAQTPLISSDPNIRFLAIYATLEALGGAIMMQTASVAHPLTVSGCQFDNNLALSGYFAAGGAIYVIMPSFMPSARSHTGLGMLAR